MAVNGISLSPMDGIVEEKAGSTIENLCRLGNEGSPYMDNIILDIIMKKQQKL